MPNFTFLNVFAVGVGACVGALARWGVSVGLNPLFTIPVGTLAVNLIGGYLIGMAIAVFQHLPNLDPAWRLFCVTGFLGGLTTFSSFSAEVVQLLQTDRWGLALLTASLHVIGSLVLTVLGIKSMEWLLT